MKRSFLILSSALLLMLIASCSDNVKMESEEEAEYNDSVAACIYRNGNPKAGTEEYRRVEDMCERY